MQDSHDSKTRTRDGCFSGSSGREATSSHFHATVEKWASEEEQAVVPEEVIKEMAAVKAQHISTCHLLFTPLDFFFPASVMSYYF